MSVTTEKSYRYATRPEEGVGFMENTGDDWVFPEARSGAMAILDDNNNPQNLILDYKSGLWYNIMTRDGPTGSGLTKRWKDKVAVAGTGGTDIVPGLIFGEDTGTFEHYFIEHLETHLYVRPYDESKRGTSGYDSNGFIDDLEFDLSIYENGNPSTAKATTENIPFNGDISFDRKAEAHRLQLKVTANKGEHLIVGRQQYYIAKDQPALPDDLMMSEMNYQEAFSTPVLWPDITGTSLINRVTGVAITATYTAVTDPTAYTRALRITGATTLGSVSLTGAGVLLIWYNGAITITIGGVVVALTTHATSGSWTLAYANALTASGNVIITPVGASSDIYDLRILNTAISTAQRTYYYNDIIDNAGGVMIPR